MASQEKGGCKEKEEEDQVIEQLRLRFLYIRGSKSIFLLGAGSRNLAQFVQVQEDIPCRYHCRK